MKENKKIAALILTGGVGSRIKRSRVPKQFIKIAGKPLFIHLIERYEALREVNDICLVINQDYRDLYEKILRKCTFRKLSHVVNGGKLRQESLKNGVLALTEADYIVIHNGSEPAASAELIKKCIKLAREHGAAIAFEPSYDTVFIKDDHKIKHVVPRDSLGNARAPMVIKRDILFKALQRLDPKVNRQMPMIELMERNHQPVFLVESHPDNIKVTFDRDLKAVDCILKRPRR